MTSKTPQFDRALDEYFSQLALDEKGGQWRTCRFSGEKFYIRPEDIGFYKKLRVPLPTLSPNERLRRRLAFCNSYNLFRGTSAFSGKSIVSAYPPKSPYTIYEHQVWYSDEWDPMTYGRTFDPSEGFFRQFGELQKTVPRPNLFTDSSNVRSDYTNTSRRLKNSYLAFDTLEGENLYYFVCCMNNRDCVDCDTMFGSEICYECLRGTKLYKCFFCELCEDCLESYFLYDCRNCSNCFGGINLRNKKYIFFNEQLTKEEYERKMKNINLGNYKTLEEYKYKFLMLKKKAIHPALHLKNAVNCVGEFVDNSKDCYFVYYLYDSEKVAYSMGSLGMKDSYDVLGGTYGEECYELLTVSTENIFNVKFSLMINESRDVEYCDLMGNCHECFGCVGLRNKSFCIFNTQYTEPEYWRKADAIKTAMLKNGEYGEFFPSSLSPFPYNISYAMSFRGFNDADVAKKYGYRIEDIGPRQDFQGEVIPSKDLPLDIKDVDDSTLTKIVLDEEASKKFRITPYELGFYQKYALPLPRKHPDVRRDRKLNYWYLRMQFYERTCPRCGRTTQSYFDPAGPETVYCIECYRKEIA